MGRRKLRKFSEVLSFPNVYECFDASNPSLSGINAEPVELKGAWLSKHFQNENPITLELACGGGEYTLALAARYPERNFIGVDIKGARIWKGARKAIEQGLPNAAFLRCRIELIAHFFATNEVSEIWITFPDPFLRESKENRRLTSANFLKEYRKILQANGTIHLKTDEPNLYQFTLDTIKADDACTLHYADDDIYAKELPYEELAYKTLYENKHLANGISSKYVRFSI